MDTINRPATPAKLKDERRKLMASWKVLVLGPPQGHPTDKAAASVVDWSPEFAADMLRALDLALHPWGEPGVVPMDAGPVFIHVPAADGGVTYNDAVLYDSEDDDDDDDGLMLTINGQHYDWDDLQRVASDYAWSFRRRWTPEGPVT